MKRVLVVDDDRIAINALQILLELDGYEVTALDSSPRAVDLVGRERFDAVVTDLEMPGAHGTEVVRAAISANPVMPILVVTAYAGSAASAKALALGARRIFSKPLRYELLADELAAVLA